MEFKIRFLIHTGRMFHSQVWVVAAVLDHTVLYLHRDWGYTVYTFVETHFMISLKSVGKFHLKKSP